MYLPKTLVIQSPKREVIRDTRAIRFSGNIFNFVPLNIYSYNFPHTYAYLFSLQWRRYKILCSYFIQFKVQDLCTMWYLFYHFAYNSETDPGNMKTGNTFIYQFLIIKNQGESCCINRVNSVSPSSCTCFSSLEVFMSCSPCLLLLLLERCFLIYLG